MHGNLGSRLMQGRMIGQSKVSLAHTLLVQALENGGMLVMGPTEAEVVHPTTLGPLFLSY